MGLIIRAFLLILFAVSTIPRCLAFDVKELEPPPGAMAWLVEDHEVPLVTVKFSFAQGELSDPKGQEGAALLLSGMIDEGAGTLSGEEFRAQMEDIGLKVAFRSQYDRFEGSFAVPSESRDEAAKLLQLALQKTSFPPPALERMRNYFLMGNESEERQPDALAERRALAIALPGHPYASRATPNPEALKHLTRDNLAETERRIFSRAGLKIAIVGDITPQEAERFIATIFGDLPEGIEHSAPQMAHVTAGPHTNIVPFDNSQTLLQFGQEAIPPRDPDYLAAQIATFMTASTINGIARQQQGLTYGASYEMIQLEQASLTVGRLRTANEKAGQAVAAIKEAMSAMRLPGPDQVNLDYTKVYLKGKFALGFDSSADVADSLMRLQIEGFSSNYFSKYVEFLDAVTLEDVRRAINRLVDPDKLIIVAVGKPVGLNEQ